MFGTVGKGGKTEVEEPVARCVSVFTGELLLSGSLSPDPIPFRAHFPVAHIPARSTEGGH